MSTPLFIIGMARNGTTITDRLLRQCAEIETKPYVPYDRWDFAAAMEIGGDIGKTPVLDAAVKWAFSRPLVKYATIKLAMPWAYEGFGWPELLLPYPAARFVLILRHHYPAWQSWSKMPHVQRIRVRVAQSVYRVWHDRMAALYSEVAALHADRVRLISYESLVRGADGALAPVWDMLGVQKPENLQRLIKQPKHWNTGEMPT